MSTFAQLTAAAAKIITQADLIFYWVNGPDTDTITTSEGEQPTIAKALKDFDDAGDAAIAELLAYNQINTISTAFDQIHADAEIEKFWQNLRVMPYESLEAANLDIGIHNVQFYNTTLQCVQMTT